MNEFKIKKGLIVQGSGSLFPILDIQGSQGELFSVTDSLSGSLSSVNDISGLPILEVFSDDTVKLGTYNAEGLIVSGSTIKVGRLSTNVHTVTGSLNISGSVNVVNGVINNLTASFAVSASRAVTSSFALITSNAITSDESIRIRKSEESNLNTAFTNTTAGTITYAESYNQTNAPTADSYYNTLSFRHSNPGNVYGTQLTMNWIGAEAYTYVRVVNNNTFGTWRQLLMENTTQGSKYFGSDGAIHGTIFYDSNNTAYYVNPASTSRLEALTVTNTITGNISGNAATATNVAYSGLTGTVPTWNQSTTGNAATANSAIGIVYNDGPRDLSNRLPNWLIRSAYFDFVVAGIVEGTGNYGGVLTFAPWAGTTVSTGDSSYQLGFANRTGVNASGIPDLKLRNGIDSTWNSWNTILHSSNYAAYSTFSGAVYGTQFIDSNNTGYYLDPASTSKLNTVIAEYYQSSGSTSPSFEVNRGAGSRYLFGSNVSITGSGIFDITAGLWRLVVKDTTGYIGIKTENPGYDLDVNGTVRAATSVTAPIYYDSDSTAYYVNPASTTVLNTLQVGVSITAPIYYDPNNASYYLDPASSGDSIRVAGDIVAYYSDERLKDKKGNIENPLEKVLSLNGFYYEPNEKAQQLGYIKKMEVGVSAQEVEAVMPEIVKDAPIGHGYKTLNYAKLVPLLIEAIKEQQTQIEEIKRNCKCYE